MPNRRAALGLAAILPVALAARQAQACSIAVDAPETFAARLPQVAKLFTAWFAREEAAFDAAFADTPARQLFTTLFVDLQSTKQLVAMTAVGDAVFVAVSEQPASGIGADCSGMPTLRLFLIGYRGDGSATIRLIEDGSWSGMGQTAHWSL